MGDWLLGFLMSAFTPVLLPPAHHLEKDGWDNKVGEEELSLVEGTGRQERPERAVILFSALSIR